MFRDWAARKVSRFSSHKQKSFVKPEACAIIFSTASPVFKFMKKRNIKIKNVYVAAHATPFFVLLTKTFYETRDLGFRRTFL